MSVITKDALIQVKSFFVFTTIAVFTACGIALAEPSIIDQPQSQTQEYFGTAVFSVNATGTPPLGYQWQFNDVNLSGATSSSLTLKNIQPAEIGNYRVLVSDADGFAFSDEATLTGVIAPPPSGINGDYTVSEQWLVIVNGTRHYGKSTGTIHVTDGNFTRLDRIGPPHSSGLSGTGSIYEGGGMDSHYLIREIGANSQGYYPIIRLSFSTITVNIGRHASNSIDPNTYETTGSIDSGFDGSGDASIYLGSAGSVNIKVYSHSTISRAGASGPKIIAQPRRQAVLNGDAVFISVLANGAAPLYYQWKRNGKILSDDEHLTGTYGATVVISSAEFSDAGTYSVIVMNGKGSVTSAGAVLTVNTAPSILNNPASQTVIEGSTVSFNVLADGTKPFKYQWFFNDAPLARKTNATLMFKNVAISNSGNYFVAVSNAFGSVASEAATLVVVSNPFPSVTGIYNGIFSVPSTGVTEETAGFVRDLKLGLRGAYSGKLLINGTTNSFSGGFDAWGHAHKIIPRRAAQGGNLTIDMNVLWEANHREISGSVSGTNGGPWTAELLLIAKSTNKNSAEFTMLISPTEDAPLASPDGYGYATITNKSGTLIISGRLADGTALNQSVPLDEVNSAPLYANLYHNTGVLLGWLNFDGGSVTNADQIPAGDITWIKKAVHSRGIYTNGFTNVASVLGSIWRAPAKGIPALPFTTNAPGLLNISGGNAIDLTYNVAVSTNNNLVKLSGSPTNSLSGGIDPKTGLLTVTFGNGHGNTTSISKGAILQATTNAAGFFLGTNQSGTTLLRFAP